MTPEEKMAALALSFPSATHLPGVMPWDALKLAKHYGVASSGERLVISFLQTVWDMDQDLVPAFNAVEATARWDANHRRAFAAWAARPFKC